MNIKTISAAVVGAVAIGLSVSTASAEAVTMTGSISGIVTSTGGAVPGVAAGSLVTGSYSYDDSVVTSGLSAPINPFTAFSLSIGANPRPFTLADLLSPPFSGRDIGNSIPTQDLLTFVFTSTALEEFIGANQFSIIQSLNFPPPPSLESFAASFIDPTRDFSFNFQATPSPATPIPTPALLPGLIGMGAAALRKRKQEQKEVVEV